MNKPDIWPDSWRGPGGVKEVFRVVYQDGRTYRIFENGSTEGFAGGIVFNHLHALIQDAERRGADAALAVLGHAASDD